MGVPEIRRPFRLNWGSPCHTINREGVNDEKITPDWIDRNDPHVDFGDGPRKEGCTLPR
jgi:hypothetical protein